MRIGQWLVGWMKAIRFFLEVGCHVKTITTAMLRCVTSCKKRQDCRMLGESGYDLEEKQRLE
jgi:hypothetical protein